MNSETEKEVQNRRKRYKMILDPNCDPDAELSKKTRKTWSEAAEKKKNEMGAKHSLETSTCEISEEFEVPEDFDVSDTLTENLYALGECLDSEDDDDDDGLLEHVLNKEDSTHNLHQDMQAVNIVTEQSSGNDTNTLEDEKRIMFEKSGLTVSDVIQMIVAFSVRYGSTNKQRESLLEIVKLCAGPDFHSLQLSNYKMSKICDPPADKVKYHFYCDKCSTKIKILKSCVKSDIKNNTVLCSDCKESHTISFDNSNVFLSIDLEYQLQLLFHEKEIAQILSQQIRNAKTNLSDSVIRDVTDGQLYKQLIRSEKNVFTYLISTDGAPIFNMSKRAFWPYQILLNFLPPHLRFKYILLIGIMIVRNEPKPDLMNLFVNTLNEQNLNFSVKGIKLNFPDFEEEIVIRFVSLGVISDSVARAILQNRIQFNGYFGCSYCYHKGWYIHEEGAKGIKFPFLEETPTLRTHQSHLQDVADIKKIMSSNEKKKQSNVRGVKGESAFQPSLDMVWGFPLDYLHNAIIGVTEQIWQELNAILTPSQRKEVDQMLINIQPPREVHRVPEKISSKGVWKGTHWKSWLLYYSLPILSKFIPQINLEHYALFVNSINTLLKLEISEDDLRQCEKDLMVFVAKYQFLYGTQKMTFNIHMLLHAVSSVRMSGPLWATSTFPFEHNIYTLKNLVNGTKCVEQQMAIKSLSRLSYQVAPLNPNLSNNVIEFCKNLFVTKTFTQSCMKFETTTFFGPSPKNKFQQVQEFDRCYLDNKMFASINYLKSKKFNDTVLRLKNKKIVQITGIKLLPNVECRLEVRELVVEPFLVGQKKVEHIWKIVKNTDHLSISLSDIESKCVVIDLKNNDQFVCLLVNTVEAQ